MKIHPAAEIFDLLDDADLRALAADIKANGQTDPIVLLDGAILDGRNRLRACELADVEPVIEHYSGALAPEAFVLSKNLHRRHLSESQRALVGAKLCKNSDKSSREVAKLLNVSHTTVCAATKVLALGDEKIIAKVSRGEMTVNRAHHRAVRTEAREAPPLPDGKYDVILADPPWQFSNDAGGSSPDRYYPTMKIEDICALPIGKLAADSSVLFLWACSALLPEALRVVDAWGFTYKTNMVWHKPNHTGLGYYVRNAHELLLIATRGSMLPDESRPESVISEPRGAHSAKPDRFHEVAQAMYPGPGTRRLELFARRPREGWTLWGNQAPAEAA